MRVNKELAMISGHRSSSNICCALIGIAVTGCLAENISDQDDVHSGQSATVQELSQPSPAGATASVKAVPVKPPDPPGVTTDGTLPVKPAASAAAAAASAALADTWTVNLVASQASLWSGIYTTLTATTNMDVGPTPYYIRIWDSDSGAYIATCGFGFTCSIPVVGPGERTTTFKAVVATATGITVASAFASVYWHIAGVRLTESEATVAAGSPVLLTAFTDYDIISSPYYVEILDDTTNTVLRICPGGTRCSVTVNQATATTHRYRACFSGFGASYPPPNILECSTQRFVTWTGNNAMRVFLQPSASNAITAVSPVDVGSNSIQIYRLSGERIATCSSGTSCSFVGNASCDDHMIAFVGPSLSTLRAISSRALAASRVFSMRLWTGQGVPIGPCPGPAPGR